MYRKELVTEECSSQEMFWLDITSSLPNRTPTLSSDKMHLLSLNELSELS